MCFGFDSGGSARFTNYGRLYSEFAITGLKITWIPGQMRQVEVPGNNANIRGIVTADINNQLGVTAQGMNLQDIETQQTYKVYGYENGFSRYIDLKAFSASNNYGW